MLQDVVDCLLMQEMCDKVFVEDTSSLQKFSDWFVTQQKVKSWHDDYDYCDDKDGVIEWYEDYQKHKANKAQIKKELSHIACHTSRWSDWCVPENEKKETEKLWA